MNFCNAHKNDQERDVNEDDSDDGREGNDKDNEQHLAQEQEEKTEERQALIAKLGGASSAVPEIALTPTLSEVTLEVKPGELVCVYGPTGCGKSSLLLSLLGEVRRLEGTVEVRGEGREREGGVPF